MRVDIILMMGAAFSIAGALLGWITIWPSFRRMAEDLRMRDWNLAHLRAEHAEQQLLLRSLTEEGPQVVLRLDASGQPTYVSPSCQAVLGYTPADIRQGRKLDLTRSTTKSRLSVPHLDGRMVALSARRQLSPEGNGTTLVLTDITDHARTEGLLAEARGKLRQRTAHDPLTGLANRESFMAALERMLTNQHEVAVLLLDLDRFRIVNDQHGHDVGDRLLREVAARLTETMAGEPLVARLGDDDFAVMLRATDGDTAIAARARDLIAALSTPIPTEIPSGNPTGTPTGPLAVGIGASIGIALSPRDGRSAIGLLRAAAIAMTHAREAGGNTYRFFENRMAEALARADELRRQLPSAIESGDILPYFQPLVQIEDGAIVGFEVLARWAHPTLGLLPPSAFLSLVEDCGLSAGMFSSLLTRACQAALDWPEHIKLAVNMSPIELQDTAMPDTVRDILRASGFPGHRLEIEITENALVHDARIAREVLDGLRGLGLTVALDDFGTGYSSLYHLRELPFDKVKIDKAFMRNLDRDPEAVRYVAAIIDFGQALGLDLTAEGIEDEATLDRLRALGCRFGQGYLFGRPMPAEEADRLMFTCRPAEMAAQ